MVCACCGEDRDATALASLVCHDDIKLCRGCIGWLMGQAGGLDVTPTLPVRDVGASASFYESAGFRVELYDDGFAFVRHGDQSVFDLGRVTDLDPAANHAGCYIITGDTDAWHAQCVDAGLTVTDVEDKPWGMHEYTLTDPDGNAIRVGRSLAP